MTKRRLIDDQGGTTLNELMVGMAAGMVVFLALTSVIVVTLHTSTRVSARVDATQRARIALTRVIDQLHSACIAPKIAPIREGSTDTELRFVHATGSAVSPTPTLSVIAYSGETLTQTDYAWREGSAPNWVFDTTTPQRTVQLIDRVRPLSASRPVFSYYSSSSGSISTTALDTPLTELGASQTIHVAVAFLAEPTSGDSGEDATPARVQGSASLRLTTASYNPAAQNLPCE